MFRLVISDDAGKTTVVALVRDEITLGRADDNHICLTERNVSRHHAKVVKHEGSYRIDDLGSYNGLKVNGTRIEGSALLGPGDRIGLGDYQIRFESEEAEQVSTDEDVDIDVPLPARLVMLTAPAAGAEYALARLPAKLGRSEDVELTVGHRSISREHAEFAEIDGAVVLRDLESANGVRINGEEVSEATLEDGDIVELGQVRFRFVPAGVEYTYDPNAPIPEPAPPEDDVQRRPIIAAVLIVVVAIAAAAAIATKGARRAAPPPPTAAVAPTAEQTARELASAIAQCEQAAGQERWEEALRHAERAVAIDPGASAAHDCRAKANAGANAGSIATQAVAMFRAGETVRAFRELEAIPAGNLALRQPDVLAVARAYAEQKLTEAETAIESSTRAPAELAGTEAAAAIEQFALEDLRPRADFVRAAVEQMPADAPPADAAQAQEATDPTAPAAAQLEQVAATAPAAAAGGGLAVAQERLAAGDVDGVLAATEGDPSVQALDLRFRALRRAPGRRSEAVRAARTLVQRFPSSQAAARAQEYLEPSTP